MFSSATTRRKPGLLVIALLLAIVAVLLVTGCHVHPRSTESSVEAHCSLCDLALGFVAVLAAVLLLLRVVRTNTFCPVASPAYRSVVTHGTYIRPPPEMLFA